MAGNITGSGAATAQLVQEVWTREVEKVFTKALQFAKLVQRRDGLVAGGGDTVNIPFNTTGTARDKAASTNVTYDNDFGTPITISINKHKYYATLIEDFAKVQANYDLASLFRGQAGEAVARAQDTDLAGLYVDADNSVSCGASADDADMLSIVQYLDGADVPRSERRGVIHSEFENDLLNVNKYTAYDQTGSKGVALADGMVSRVYQMDMYMSNNTTEEAGTPNLQHNVFFHRSALTLAQQLKPTYKMEDSVDAIGMKAVLHCIYGVKTERSDAVVDAQLNS
jgi:hypothetical protein